MRYAQEMITEVIESLPRTDLFTGPAVTRNVASVFAVATVVSILAAEFRRRSLAATSDSPYTENFSKAIGIAVTIVLALASAVILTFEPAVAGDLAVWTGFASLVGACTIPPTRNEELVEIHSKGIYGLYWMPVLFAGSLLAVMFFGLPS